MKALFAIELSETRFKVIILIVGHADATTLLLLHGADSNRQDRKGRTPAHCGSAKGQFETIKLISK